MIPIERVEGGVLLPLDQLHKRAREAGVLRMPNQVFIPDDVLAELGCASEPAPVPSVAMDPSVGTTGSDLKEPPSVVTAPADPTSAIPAEIRDRAVSRPVGWMPASTFDEVKERVRKKVMGEDDRAQLKAEMEGIELSPDQQSAFDGLRTIEGNSSILTGKAGTGKSTVVKSLRLDRPVALCATTGIAAMNIGACTVDSMFSYDRTTNAVRSSKRRDMIMEMIPNTIVIDEASMIGERMAGYLLNTAKAYRKKLVLVGDWAQAAPVKDGWATETELVLGSRVHALEQVHRQSDTAYLEALNDIRRGEVTQRALDTFRPCMVSGPPDDDRYIRLFATNAATDAYNMQRLMAVPETTKIWRLFAEYFDDRDEHLRERHPTTLEQQNEALKKSRMAHGTQFRVGARVMITMNDPGDDIQFVNGDLGTIVGAELSDGTAIDETPAYNPFTPGAVEPTPDYVVVKLDRTGVSVRIPRLNQEIKDALGKAHFTVRGLPLALGWAITIHKAQGLTVDRAYLDMETITFMKGESRHGLAYVAMSRTRTLEGLMISGWTDKAVYCSPHVRRLVA